MGLDDTVTADVRVAIDTGPLHGHRTGIGNAVAWTVDALTERADVELLPYVVSMRASVQVPERRLPIPAALAHRWWMHRSPPLDWLLRQPDLVHGTNYVVPPTTCPQLVSVYDCWFLEHPDDVTADVTRAARLLRRAVDGGAHVVASSDATAERVRSLLDTDRVTTVLLGPPPVLDAHGITAWPVALDMLGRNADDGSDPFVLSLGTVERRKNVPRVVQAFARVAAEHAGVRLVIAGAPGNDQPAVDRAIAALPAPIADRVTCLGAVDQNLKAALLRRATVLAYPSLDEGFGFPLLEAQQADLPVVASTAGSIPEVAGAGALYARPDDVDAIAANVHLALTSDTVPQKLIAQGRTNLERFSWAQTAEQLTELYLDLANGRR